MNIDIRIISLVFAYVVMTFNFGCATLSETESERLTVHSDETTTVSSVNSVNSKIDPEFAMPSMDDNRFDGEQLIRSGYGTEKVHLGMSSADLRYILGEPSDEYSYDTITLPTGEVLQASCVYKGMHWFPKSNDDGKQEHRGNGISAYLQNDRAYEISFSEEKTYQTLEGIDYLSPLEELKNKIGAPLYVLSPSATHANNFEDLIYMVVREKGIAFELGSGYKTENRSVSAIYVFAKFGDFAPWGCISRNQSFRKISD